MEQEYRMESFKKNSNTLGKKVHSTFDILKEVQYS